MYIIGASGHAKSVLDLLEDLHVVKSIFDDNQNIKSILGIPVTSPIPQIFPDEYPAIIAIGDNIFRKKIVEKLSVNTNYCNISHRTALVSKNSTIGKGVVIMENSIIKVDSVIGDHVIINTAASVDHDCSLENFVHLAPSVTLCGNINIGEGTLVGVGSVILPGITIGKWCVIGAGSVVHKDMPDGSRWMGTSFYTKNIN
jgi:sugar O-acyltransferase (sialic acid O-acetyltransferase NeuD family)